jgi:hypothetical protein
MKSETHTFADFCIQRMFSSGPALTHSYSQIGLKVRSSRKGKELK